MYGILGITIYFLENKSIAIVQNKNGITGLGNKKVV